MSIPQKIAYSVLWATVIWSLLGFGRIALFPATPEEYINERSVNAFRLLLIPGLLIIWSKEIGTACQWTIRTPAGRLLALWIIGLGGLTAGAASYGTPDQILESSVLGVLLGVMFWGIHMVVSPPECR